MSEDGRDTVLIIDDDSDFRDLIVALGQICAVPILTAADCHRGLQVIRQQRGRLKTILLDYFMPGMDPETCAKNVVEKAGADVVVVLLTAAADPGRRASRLNIRRWVSKPADISVLTGLLIEGASR